MWPLPICPKFIFCHYFFSLLQLHHLSYHCLQTVLNSFSSQGFSLFATPMWNVLLQDLCEAWLAPSHHINLYSKSTSSELSLHYLKPHTPITNYPITCFTYSIGTSLFFHLFMFHFFWTMNIIKKELRFFMLCTLYLEKFLVLSGIQ